MCCQLPVDTSVISPIAPSGAGISSGAPSPTPSAPPMTLSEQTYSQNTEVPNYLNQAPPVNALPVTPASPAPVPPQAAEGSAFPAIQVMFEQLKNSGILLSDIEIKAKTDISPLAHLQPGQLIPGDQGPQPAFLTPNQPSAASTIQLASTAPVVKNPTSNHVAQYMASKRNNFVVGVTVGLVIVLVFVGAVFGYQYYVRMTNNPSWTETSAESYDAVLNTIPFVESDSGTPEAVWYQEQ